MTVSPVSPEIDVRAQLQRVLRCTRTHWHIDMPSGKAAPAYRARTDIPRIATRSRDEALTLDRRYGVDTRGAHPSVVASQV